jgi:hypothetical protein
MNYGLKAAPDFDFGWLSFWRYDRKKFVTAVRFDDGGKV